MFVSDKTLQFFDKPQALLNRSVMKKRSFGKFNPIQSNPRLFQTTRSITHTTATVIKARKNDELCTTEKDRRESSSSRMRVIYHNWSATEQRPHPQSVAEISRHSVLSGDRI